MSMRHSVAQETARAERRTFADDVEYYLSLSPRQLPSQYLYDELGSALFEAICRLPWYPITRTEQRLLASRARDIMACLDGNVDDIPLSTLVELGPGSGEKLMTLLDAIAARGDGVKQRHELLAASGSELHQRRQWNVVNVAIEAGHDVAGARGEQPLLGSSNGVPRKPADGFEQGRAQLVVEVLRGQLSRAQRQVVLDVVGEGFTLGSCCLLRNGMSHRHRDIARETSS